MNGKASFNNAKIGSQVTAGFTDTINEKITDLLTKTDPLIFVQRHKVAVTMYTI